MDRRLNVDEVSSLSLEMKVCYMLQPWTSYVNPQTMNEWAEQVGFFNYKEAGESNADKKAVEKALADAEYYLNYIKTYIL